eukprot:4440949-Amphidinium_carterae.1
MIVHNHVDSSNAQYFYAPVVSAGACQLEQAIKQAAPTRRDDPTTSNNCHHSQLPPCCLQEAGVNANAERHVPGPHKKRNLQLSLQGRCVLGRCNVLLEVSLQGGGGFRLGCRRSWQLLFGIFDFLALEAHRSVARVVELAMFAVPSIGRICIASATSPACSFPAALVGLLRSR